MNLEYLGAELNLSVLAGCRPDYELEFTCGADRLNVSDVTFSGVVTAADGTVQPIVVQHTSAINLLRVEFPLMEVPGDYLWEIAYHVGDGKRCRVAYGRLGVLATSLAAEVESKPVGARRLSVRMPEVAGGQVVLEWQGTTVALYAAKEAVEAAEEMRSLLTRAEALSKQALGMLDGVKEGVTRRVIVNSFDALPETGLGNVQYLVADGKGGWDVYVWAQVAGAFGGWFRVGTEADISLVQADSTTSGAVRLARDLADDTGVATAKQVREYVKTGAGFVTEEELEPYALTSEVENRMRDLHEDVLTSDNATRFVEISRAEFEALPSKANNVYYLIYDSTI
jgi:hypothetical protein